MHSTHNLDDGYMGGGKRIRNSIRKHGKDAHTKEILEYFDDRESLRQREIEIVNEDLLNDPMCMNLQPGGGGGIIGPAHMEKFSKEGNRVFRERLKNDEYRNKFIESTRECRIKGTAKSRELYEMGIYRLDTFKGKTHKPETIEKMRDSKIGHGLGKENSQFGKVWIINQERMDSLKIDRSDLDTYLRDGWTLGRFPNCSNQKLDDSKVYQIKIMLSSGHKQKYIASIFGVSVTTVAKISKNETWKHIIINN